MRDFRNEHPAQTLHEPRGDSRPRLSGGAQLRSAGPVPQVSRPLFGRQPGNTYSMPPW